MNTAINLNNKKYRILFILSHLPQGGAERQTINLISNLNPNKFDITLLLYDNKEVFYDEIYRLPVKVIKHKKKINNKIIRHTANFFFIKRHLSLYEYDIVHTLLFHNGLWVRLAAPKKLNNRIVYSVRNSMKNASTFYLFFEKIFARSSIIVTNSEKSRIELSNILGQNHNEKIITIYNGFDLKKFTVKIKPPIIDKILIGTVGRQTTQKNQIQILQAIKKLRNLSKIDFKLIGDINHESSKILEQYVIKNKLDDIVTIMNSKKNIETYYKQFNIFVLSSIYEGCPNVLFEAMLSKCLCVVSDGSNSDQFIKDGVNGFVYDGTLNMLVEKLKHAIDLIMHNKADTIINNGFDYASNNFSMKKMVSSYENLYENLNLND